jgi:hypothetical protein
VRVSSIIAAIRALYERNLSSSPPSHLVAIYAYDTMIHSSSNSPVLLCQHLQFNLEALASWCRQWGLSTNAAKSKALLKTENCHALPTPLVFNDMKIPWCSLVKYLGVIILKVVVASTRKLRGGEGQDSDAATQMHILYCVAEVNFRRRRL